MPSPDQRISRESIAKIGDFVAGMNSASDCYRELSVDGGGLLPLSETTAQKGGGTAFPAQHDDVIVLRELPVPGQKCDSGGGYRGKNPVIGGLLLDPAQARKNRCHSHRASSFPRRFGILLCFRRNEERSDRSVIFYGPLPDPIFMGRWNRSDGFMAEKNLC
jgi:hypothetical protein